MAEPVDFVVKSPDNKPRVFVEATSSVSPRELWAAHVRRNLLAHTALAPNAYFILARPDNFYIWRDATSPGTLTPNQTIPTVEILAPYISSALSSSLKELSKEGF